MATELTSAPMLATAHKAAKFREIYQAAHRILQEQLPPESLSARELLARAHTLWYASYLPCPEAALATAYAAHLQEHGSLRYRIEATFLMACIAIAELQAKLAPTTDIPALISTMTELHYKPLWPNKTDVSRPIFEHILTKLETSWEQTT